MNHQNWKRPDFKIHFEERSRTHMNAELLDHLIDRFLIKNLFGLNRGKYFLHLNLELNRQSDQHFKFSIQNLVKFHR